jgi:DNA-directed RNA polymerase subunit beta'
MVERRDPCIWDLLAEVLFERVILLNRAPTLHRLSIQAFQPHLIEGNAIQLHPLVCSAFNADFDGDQMAVHVPLSDIAQDEAYRLLLSTHNLRQPASGEPSIAPSQEIVLGCFYLTEDRPSKQQAGHIFTDANEARLAYAAGILDIHTHIVVRVPDQVVFESPPPSPGHIPQRGRIATTFGRLLFNEIVPMPLGYRNYPMSKEWLKALVAECLTTCGEETTVRFLDEMKRIGYQYATKSGISFALSDITMPPEREVLIQQGQQHVHQVDEIYHRGELTTDEWYRQVIDIWTSVTEEISSKLKNVLDPYGTIMTIVKSGATKAKFQQIRQLSGIRGLLASPTGKIIPIPVLSNYLLGLLVWEIFIAASGARKGFMDRSLNTAMSGYLTRRLVEAGMEVIISQRDCHTTEGMLVSNEDSQHMGLPTMQSRVIGRVLAEAAGTCDVGTLLDAKTTEALLAAGIERLFVRSPLTCQASRGVCQYCYGLDLATGQLVALGTAVGIIAGQSIGEPGTQLTMRTFHSGGIAQNASDITLGLPRVNELFEARTPTHSAILAKRSGIVQTISLNTNTGEHIIHFSSATTVHDEEREEWIDTLPSGCNLALREGQMLERGMPLVEGSIDPHDLLRILGRDAVQHYLINEVQRVYRGTGAIIHDKHLEVIVRQMLRYVMVMDGGDTQFVPGETLDRFIYMQRVTEIVVQGGQPAFARPVLLGLTRAALQTSSWIAAASFQNTSRVLTQAAIEYQYDRIVGLKERLITGQKLPEIHEKQEQGILSL